MEQQQPKPQKTIDERLEALTHSVELIAAMQLKTEKTVNRLGRYIRSVQKMVLDHEIRIEALEGNGDDDND